MADIQRRAFVKGAALGAVAFVVGGSTVMLTAAQARADSVPLRLLKGDEAAIIESMGETLVPGARKAGIAHFIDQQTAGPPEQALLQARIANVRPPYINFYRAALQAIDGSSDKMFGRKFAALSGSDQHGFADLMRQNKPYAWQGPPRPFGYVILGSAAVAVCYRTMQAYLA